MKINTFSELIEAIPKLRYFCFSVCFDREKDPDDTIEIWFGRKSEASYNIWSVEHVTAIPSPDFAGSYIPSIPESWLLGDLVAVDKKNFHDFKVIKTIFREDVSENDGKE